MSCEDRAVNCEDRVDDLQEAVRELRQVLLNVYGSMDAVAPGNPWAHKKELEEVLRDTRIWAP